MKACTFVLLNLESPIMSSTVRDIKSEYTQFNTGFALLFHYIAHSDQDGA